MIAVGLPILTAVLLALSCSSFNLGLFAWCGFIPLLIALEKRSLPQALAIAFLAGVVFWGFCLYWLIHVTLLGQIILILYLSLYFGFFGGLVYFSRFLPLKSCLFFLPSGWVLLEYLRSYLFTGFPWALIGYSQYKNLSVIQIADITGAWGVSFLVVCVNVALYLVWRKRGGIKIILILGLLLLFSLGYGLVSLNFLPDGTGVKEQFKVTVIQGNIPQDLKWDMRAVAFIQDRYSELTTAAAAGMPELIVWPESSVPGVWGKDETPFEQVYSLARSLKTNLLVGAVSCAGQNYFNSALLINPSGTVVETYSKLHLVPFGEYIPLKNILPFLETFVLIGDIAPGREYTIFKLHLVRVCAQSANFGVLICFEDLFPELSREFIRRGARFLVNITNDAWYKEGSAPYQHFAASVFRSVENRVWLARSANTGISGFIAPSGRIMGVVTNTKGKEIFVPGLSSQGIDLAFHQRTIYNRCGDFFVVFCFLLDACVIILFLRHKK